MFNKEPGFNFICGVRRHDLGLGCRTHLKNVAPSSGFGLFFCETAIKNRTTGLGFKPRFIVSWSCTVGIPWGGCGRFHFRIDIELWVAPIDSRTRASN